MPDASSKRTTATRTAWLMLVVIYLFSLAAPLNQYKVPPMLQQLKLHLGVTVVEGGWLMSIFSLMGLVLALPSGVITKKFGLRATGLLAIGSIFLGSLIGGFAPNTAMLLGSRLLEGLGLSLTVIMAPAAIAIWFAKDGGRGTAMGLWASWVPVGAVSMLNLAPVLGTTSWVPVWWAGTLYAGAMLVLFLFTFRLPAAPAEAAGKPGVTGLTDLLAGFKNRNAWLLGACFCISNLIGLSLSSFLPSYLQTQRNMSNAQASFISSIIMICILLAGFLCGVITDKTKLRRSLIAVSMLVLAACLLLPFRIGNDFMIPLMIVIGTVRGIIPTAVFVMTPEVVLDKRDLGVTFAIIALGKSLGNCIGPALLGSFISRFGWITAGDLFIPIALLGMTAALCIKYRPQDAA